MKKYLALTMAACMALSLAACGSSASSTTSSSAAASTEATSDSAATAEATGSDNITGIAQCCDVGTLDDESFNQGCWEAVKGYGDENGIEYNYYLPSGEDASDEDRETLIRQAVADGANTIVCVGYLYGPALAWAATEYPDVHFIAVDVNGFDINSENGTIPENVFCVTFKEEEAGYLAGYAAVKDGFTKLGFLGGMAVPAVIRYGYGYVQGADAAAQELGINVQMNYYYGGQFYGDEKITAKMDGWYDGGTEVVFACGGGIWTSAAEAADKHDGKLIGVDVDQNYLGVEGVESGKYKANPFVTSAMKVWALPLRMAWIPSMQATGAPSLAPTATLAWKRATMLACPPTKQAGTSALSPWTSTTPFWRKSATAKSRWITTLTMPPSPPPAATSPWITRSDFCLNRV